MFKNKRLMSALCAFLVGGISDSVALPRYSNSGMMGKQERVEYKPRTHRRGRKGALWSNLSDTQKVALGILMGIPAVFLGLVGAKLAEIGVKKLFYVLDDCLNDHYNALRKKFHLAGALSYVQKAKKIKSIDQGIANLLRYFASDQKRVHKVDEGKKDLKDFKHSYDNMVAVCFILSLAYPPAKGCDDLNSLTRFRKAFCRGLIPGFYKRHAFEHDISKAKDANVELDASDISSFRKKHDDREDYENFWGLGMPHPIRDPFNTDMLKNWLLRVFTMHSNSNRQDNNYDEFVEGFRQRYDKDNTFGIAEGMKWTNVKCERDRLVFRAEKVRFSVSDKLVDVMMSFKIPGDKIESGEGNDLIDITFKKTNENKA